jgi:hypothetical protein
VALVVRLRGRRTNGLMPARRSALDTSGPLSHTASDMTDRHLRPNAHSDRMEQNEHPQQMGAESTLCKKSSK